MAWKTTWKVTLSRLNETQFCKRFIRHSTFGWHWYRPHFKKILNSSLIINFVLVFQRKLLKLVCGNDTTGGFNVREGGGEEKGGRRGGFNIGYKNVLHVQSVCHWKMRRKKIRFIVSHSVVDMLSICYLLADVSLITYKLMVNADLISNDRRRLFGAARRWVSMFGCLPTVQTIWNVNQNWNQLLFSASWNASWPPSWLVEPQFTFVRIHSSGNWDHGNADALPLCHLSLADSKKTPNSPPFLPPPLSGN